MGNCVGGFKRRTTRIAPWKRNRPIVLCFLGIDGAGKTTIVKALQGEDLGTVHTTVGFSRAELRVKKYRLTVYDLGGSTRIREIWSTYFSELYGIVFVVDASAASRLQENKQMVDSLVGVSDLLGKPILFLLNKKDLPEAIDEMQFSERFNLHSMAKQNKTDIRVEGVCAVKGTGKDIDQVIVEGVEWLIEKVLDNYDNIAKGVEQALKRLKERQAQDRLDRQHRLAITAAKESSEEGGSPVQEEEEEGGPEGEQTEENNAEGGQALNGRVEEAEEGGREEEEAERTSRRKENDEQGQQQHIDYGIFEINRLNERGGRVNQGMAISEEGGAEQIELRPTRTQGQEADGAVAEPSGDGHHPPGATTTAVVN